MSTETEEKLDITVKEEVDGSAVVDLPEDLMPEEAESEQKAQGGSIPDDGGDDHPDDTLAIREARRAKRKYKKEIAKATSSEKEAQLNLLKRQNELLMERLAVVEHKTHSADLARIDKAIEDQELRLQYAKMKMSEAMQSSDGDAFNKAQEMWDETRTAIRDLRGFKDSQIRPRQTNNIPDPRVQKHASDWMERNSWYNPNGQDTDSRIAKVIDEDLVKEGWNPADPDYWDELDNRLSKRINPRYNDDMGVKPFVKRPRSVQTGTGRETVNGSSNRTSFVLDPERVRAMKDAGFWDDPQKRAKMIKRYAMDARNNT
jgi:vacuolar-type H+-ATPase subunit H